MTASPSVIARASAAAENASSAVEDARRTVGRPEGRRADLEHGTLRREVAVEDRVAAMLGLIGEDPVQDVLPPGTGKAVREVLGHGLRR